MATLSEALQYIKDNPDTPLATNVKTQIANGDWDKQSRDEGIDLSWAGRPPLAKQEKPASTFTEKIADFIGGRKLAQGLGVAASNLAGGQEQVQESQAGLSQMQQRLIEQINEDRKVGKDTTSLENVLKRSQDTQQTTAKNVEDVGTQGLTNKEVLGSAAQLATNVAGAALPGAQELVTGTGLGSAAARVGLSAAQGALTSGVSGATSALAENKSTEEALSAAKSSAIAGAVFGGLAQGAAEGYKALGKAFGKAGEKITSSVIKPSQADIKDGFNVANVKKYDLDGSLAQTLEKTSAKMRSLTDELNTKLASSPEKIDLGEVYKNTVSELQSDKLKHFGSNTRTGSALNDLNEEINLLFGQEGVNVSIPDAQKVKQAAGAQGAWQYGKSDPDSTARELVYNTFYRNLKNEIEKKSPAGVQEINKQLSELIPIRNAVIRRIPVADRNNALGLGEIISLAHGITNPSSLALTGVTLASKSGQTGRALSKLGGGMTGTSKVAKIAGKTAQALTAPSATAVTKE